VLIEARRSVQCVVRGFLEMSAHKSHRYISRYPEIFEKKSRLIVRKIRYVCRCTYCYRQSSVVCLSVCRSVCHDRERCWNCRTDQDAVWDADSEGHVLDCVHIGATWWIELNRSCAAAVWSLLTCWYVTLCLLAEFSERPAAAIRCAGASRFLSARPVSPEVESVAAGPLRNSGICITAFLRNRLNLLLGCKSYGYEGINFLIAH